MTILRALLACVWVLFSLTATALPASAAPADMPCHIEAKHGQPDQAPSKSTAMVMPCCSQPVLAAATTPFLVVRPMGIVQLTPAPIHPLTSLPAGLEPRPPKTI